MPCAPPSIPLSAAPMASSTSTSSSALASVTSSPPNAIAAISSFLHHHLSQFSARLDQGLRTASASFTSLSTPPPSLAASIPQPNHAFDLALSAPDVAKTLSGTSVYTVSNSNNEFVLISDPSNGMRSLGLLCFREEDAEALLSQAFFFCNYCLFNF
jgi:Tic22-like family